MDPNNNNNNTPKESKEQKELSWRLDPEESLSDWTIEVRSDDDDARRYHVHKCILAVGPRRSEYFSRLIRGNHFAESKSNVSKIVLPDVVADAFPEFLDFMYSGDLEATTENSLPLRRIAEYFGNSLVGEKALQFIRGDVEFPGHVLADYVHFSRRDRKNALDRWKNLLARYYNQANDLMDEKVLSVISYTIAKDIDYFLPSDFLLNANPGFLSEVLSRVSANPMTSKNLSSFLVDYICRHKKEEEEMNWEMFRRLTDESAVPEVDFKATYSLLELEIEMLGSYAGPTPVTSNGLTSLQNRCVEALAKNWSNLADDFVGCETLPDNITKALFHRVLQITKEEMDETRKELRDTRDNFEVAQGMILKRRRVS